MFYLIKITNSDKNISTSKLHLTIRWHCHAGGGTARFEYYSKAKMLSKIFTTVKYTLVTINFLFVVSCVTIVPIHWKVKECLYSEDVFQITGVIILSVGSSVQSAYNGYHHFLSERFFSLPAFCIATGIIIFLIASAGFYGAFMENYMMNMAVTYYCYFGTGSGCPELDTN